MPISAVTTGQQGGLRYAGYATGQQEGFDKHFGRAVCFITVNRNIYWWTRLTVNMGIDLRENTDPCSPIKQYQVIREEPLTLEIESMIPGRNNTSAKAFVHDFRPGVIIDRFFCNLLEELFNYAPDGVAQEDRYGQFIIERSNVDVSRDDFSSMRMTLRALGYQTGPTAMAFQSDVGGPADGYASYGGTAVDSEFPG